MSLSDDRPITWDVEFDDPTNVGVLRLTLEDDTAAQLSLTVTVYPGDRFESDERAAAMLTAPELRMLAIYANEVADRLDEST